MRGSISIEIWWNILHLCKLSPCILEDGYIEEMQEYFFQAWAQTFSTLLSFSPQFALSRKYSQCPFPLFKSKTFILILEAANAKVPSGHQSKPTLFKQLYITWKEHYNSCLVIKETSGEQVPKCHNISYFIYTSANRKKKKKSWEVICLLMFIKCFPLILNKHITQISTWAPHTFSSLNVLF